MVKKKKTKTCILYTSSIRHLTVKAEKEEGEEVVITSNMIPGKKVSYRK